MQNISNFNNDKNFIFDPDKIELVSGEAQLILQVTEGDALLYCKLDEGYGLVALDSSGNGNHGAFQGGFDENQWVAGKINYGIRGLAPTAGFINFNQLIAFERTDAFSLEYWIKATDTASQLVLSKQTEGGNFEGFVTFIGGGKIYFQMRDVNGNNNTILTVGTYNDNAWHHVVCTYDGSSVAGGMNIYVDNTLDKTTFVSATLDSTITTTRDFQISGRDGAQGCLLNTTSVDEIVVYDRELTPADIAFRWNNGNGIQIIPGGSTSYPTDNPPIYPQQNTLKVTEFTGFDATIIASGSDNIFFTLLVNGIETYWNGSAWEESVGFSESNTFTEINTNASSLSLTEATILSYKGYFHSNDGTTTPKLDQVVMEYNFELVAPTLTEVTIVGNIRDLTDALDAYKFKVRPTWTIGTNNIIAGDWKSIITDSNGDFRVPTRIDDVDPTNLQWDIGDKIYLTNFVNKTEVKFSELTIVWENQTEIDEIGN